ncbi:WD40/YVTN repeat-like containing protein [Gracilaria domingensis]|nr:WD40/YVTN repeat-like containing protein [Gracilaria domingensis]
MTVSTAGLIASAPVVWTSAARYLTVPFGTILRTYDVSQSPPKCIASHVGHTSPVTSIVSMRDMRVASASRDGTLRIWDLKSGQCLHTIDVGRPLSSIDCLSPDKILAYANKELNIIDSSATVKRRSRKITRSHLQILRSEEGRVVSAKESHVVAFIEGNGLHITSKAASHLEPILTIPYRRLLTSIAITPDASKLAVGDEKGVIWIYHDIAKALVLLKRGRNILRPNSFNVSRLHWHPSAVRALMFCHQGQVLLSGGNETVLVSWQMGRTNFGVRTFIPRLTAPIIGIAVSPDENLYATTHADNAVRIIDQRTGVLMETIRGVASRLLDISVDNPKHLLSSRVDPSSVENFGATTDRTNPSRLWLAGTGPTIQLFDVNRGEQIDEHAVAPKNIIYEPTEKSKTKSHPDQLLVTLVSVHKKVNLIATIDHQDLRTADTEFYAAKRGVYNLRIWNREADGELRLVAVINEPHGSGNPVTSMSFHPRLPCLSTTSSCGTARLWMLTGSETNSWRCESEKIYKDLPCNAVAFSEDGSLQAIAYRNVITIWTLEITEGMGDSDSPDETNGNEHESHNLVSKVDLELLRVFVHPPQHEHIHKLNFIRGRVPILLAITKHGLYAWNVLTQGIWWSHRFLCDPHSMVVDEDSNRIAISIRIPPLIASSNEFPADKGATVKKAEPQSGDIAMKEILSSSGANSLAVETGDLEFSEAPKKGTGAKERSTDVSLEAYDRNRLQKGEGSYRIDEEMLSKSDTAIAVFNGGSPVPINVFRLSPGLHVAALAFVQLRSTAPRSLVSFDSNLKVTVHRTCESTEDMVSVVTEEIPALAEFDQENKQPSNLEKLLGDSWRSELLESEKKIKDIGAKLSDTKHMDFLQNENNSRSRDVVAAVSEAFQGALHVQGPVPPRLIHLMDTLLQGRSKLDGVKKDDEFIQHRTKLETKNNISSIDGPSMQHSSNRGNGNETRLFCRSLILMGHSQPSRTKG